MVITRDRWPDLQKSLPKHRAPVILLDNASADGTPESVRRHFPLVRVVELGSNRGSVARNVGVTLAATPYVAFADDDSWWEPGALERSADLFDRHPRLAVIAGKILIGDHNLPDPVCQLMADSPLGTDDDLPGPSILGFLACGAVVRRTAFLQAGGFDEVIFFYGEEERLALDLASAGWALAYVEGIVAHHHPSPVRDRDQRRALAVRNEILTALLRRPWPVVGKTVLRALKDPASRSGLRDAARRATMALRQRRAVSAEVEAQRQLLG